MTQTFLALALKVLEWLLNKDQKNQEALEAFYGFVETLGERQIIPAKMRESYRGQKARLLGGKQ